MSVAEIERFQKEAKEKEEIQKALTTAGSDVDKIVSIANQNGYVFDKDELLKFAEEHKGQLSDEDLENVAGGEGQGVVTIAAVTVVVGVI